MIENIKKKHKEDDVVKILSDIVKHLIFSDFGYIKTLGAEEIYKYLIKLCIDVTDLEVLDTEKDYDDFFDKVLNEKINDINSSGLEGQIDFIIMGGISAENIELMISI